MPSVSVPDSRDLSRLWQAVLGQLQLELNRSSFETWLRGTRPLGFDDGCLLVETPNTLHLDWMNSRFSPTVRRAFASVHDEGVDVRFVAGGPDMAAAVVDGPAVAPFAPAPTVVAGRVDSRMSLDCYHTARGNRLAYDACLALVEEPGCATSPVAIWGSPGLGKTHLLHGLAQRAARAGWPTACLSAEEFTTRFQEGLRARDLAPFKSLVRGVRLLIIDDLQYLSGKRATQEELAHTIDAVVHDGGHVVVAGELHPLALDLVERLATRLGAGVTARIEPFDGPDRRGFVEAIARDIRAALPPWALDRLAQPANVSLRLLRGAVVTAVRCQRSGMLDAERLDLDLAHVELGDHACAGKTPAAIVELVAAHYGATPEQVTGRSRNATVASARAVAAAAMNERGLSLAEIAVVLGGRNRTTLSPVVHRGKLLLDVDPGLRARLAV